MKDEGIMTTIAKSANVFGNKATKVLHTEARGDACTKSAVKKKNRVEFANAREGVNAGFRKCKHCFREMK